MLAERYPEAVGKEWVPHSSGDEAHGGGFNHALSRLQTLELSKGRGALRVSEELVI